MNIAEQANLEVNTKNAKAVVTVVAALRDEVEVLRRTVTTANSAVAECKIELQALKRDLILLKHQGSGATV